MPKHSETRHLPYSPEQMFDLVADVAVAITGVAGPGGGSDKKPVGTVVFARAEKGGDPAKVVADLRQFGDRGRGGIRLQAALCALELLLPSEVAPEEPVAESP